MKYILDVPDNTTWIQVSTDRLEPYTEPDRKTIEDEVWGLVRKIVNEMECSERYDCFGDDNEVFVIGAYSYKEVKGKYEAWLKKKDEICVGDEVEYFCGGNIRFVVCGIDNGVAYGFKYRPDFEDLDIGEYCEIDELKKTGRHFPEVAELLKKMKEES